VTPDHEEPSGALQATAWRAPEQPLANAYDDPGAGTRSLLQSLKHLFVGHAWIGHEDLTQLAVESISRSGSAPAAEGAGSPGERGDHVGDHRQARDTFEPRREQPELLGEGRFRVNERGNGTALGPKVSDSALETIELGLHEDEATTKHLSANPRDQRDEWREPRGRLRAQTSAETGRLDGR
jgi:hypothetical protein